jgi:hypothetical protein
MVKCWGASKDVEHTGIRSERGEKRPTVASAISSAESTPQFGTLGLQAAGQDAPASATDALRRASGEEEDDCGIGFIHPPDDEEHALPEHVRHARRPSDSDEIAVGLAVVILFQHTVRLLDAHLAAAGNWSLTEWAHCRYARRKSRRP